MRDDEKHRDFGGVIDEWLRLSRQSLKPTTCAAYETVISRHIRPELSAFSPAEVTPFAIERFWRQKCGEGLAPATLRSVSCVLRSIIRLGERYGCSADASVCKVPAPRGRMDIPTLSDEERGKIVSTLGKNPGGRGLGVLICLYTGLRVGEVCGLRWGDISPDNRSLRVCRTVSRIRRHGDDGKRTAIYVGEPKSADSCRRIPLPPTLTQALENARGKDECYVLTDSPDKIPEPRMMQRYFNKLLDDVGIEHMKYHALRHSFATQCVDLGFDIKALSMILGHADVGTTLNIYVHPSFERMRSMMEMLK